MDVEQRRAEILGQLKVFVQKGPGFWLQGIGLPARVNRQTNPARAGQIANVRARRSVQIILIPPGAPGLLVWKPLEGLEAVLDRVLEWLQDAGGGERALVANAQAK